MTRAEALKKVKKLLRLGKSNNVHEAAAAMRQAQALMQQHAIDERDVKEHDPDEVGGERTAPARGKVPPVYAVALQRAVAMAFGCEALIDQIGWSQHAHEFIGPRSRAQICTYAYAVLLRQLERDKRAHIARVRVRKNRNARGDAFGVGWVIGVESVLQIWNPSVGERAQIEDFRTRKYPNLRSFTANARESKAVSFGDHVRGVENGRKASLLRGVGGDKSQQRQLEAS
jgi:hypothetical protein